MQVRLKDLANQATAVIGTGGASACRLLSHRTSYSTCIPRKRNPTCICISCMDVEVSIMFSNTKYLLYIRGPLTRILQHE